MNVNLTVAETDRSINMTVPDDLHEIALDASQDSYEFEMDVDGEIDFDVASYSGAYLFRQLPYSSNAKSLRKIVGCSFAWNQQYENSDPVNLSVPDSQRTKIVLFTSGAKVVSGHKYLYSAKFSNVTNVAKSIYVMLYTRVGGSNAQIAYVNSKANGVVSTIFQSAYSGVSTGAANAEGGFWGYDSMNANDTNGSCTISDCQLFDLTAMFGSTIADYIYTFEQGTAGAGVAFFKNLFPKDYYSYDAGSIVSVKTSASTMKNADESETSSYALDNTELRGILKKDANNNLYYDGDEYTADGTVKRKYGIVDLGTLSWTYTAATEVKPNSRFSAALSNGVTAVATNLICAKYISSREPVMNRLVDKTICQYGGNVYICDSGYTDAAAFKTAVSGVYLVYELATPTTESATAYTQAQKCYPNGTEEFVDGRTVEVPVWNEAKYIVRQ